MAMAFPPWPFFGGYRTSCRFGIRFYRTYGGSELRAKNVDSCHLGLPNVVCMFMELKILRDYNENILAKIHKSGS